MQIQFWENWRIGEKKLEFKMESNDKKLIGNTIIMYVQLFLNIIIGFLVARILIRVLGESDYGTYMVVGGFVSTMALISMPMVSGIQRFFAFDLGKNDYEQLAKDFNTTNYIYILLGVISVILLETIGLCFLDNVMMFDEGRMGVVHYVYHLSVFSFFFNVIAHPYNALLLAHENIFIFSLFSVLDKLGQLLIVIIILYIPYDHLLLYSILSFFLAIIMRLLPHVYCYTHYKESHFQLYWDKVFFHSIFSYSIYNTIGVLSGLGRSQGINIILNIFYGPVVNAARAVSGQLQKLVQSLYSSIGTPARPQITKYYSQGRFPEMWLLVERSTKVMFYICLLIAIPLALEAEYILKLWLGEYPEYTPIFLRLSLLVSLFSSTYLISCVLQAANRIKREQIYQATITLMTLPLGYIALRIGYGPIAPFVIAAFLQLIASLVSVLVVQLELKKNMSLFYLELFRLYIAGGLSVIAPLGIIVCLDPSFLRLIVVILVSVISQTCWMYFLCLNKEERVILKHFVEKKLLKYTNKLKL